MGLYGDLVVYDIHKPCLCLEFDNGKVYAGIVRNDIGRSKVDINPTELQSLPGLLRCKYSKKTTYLERCGYIDHIQNGMAVEIYYIGNDLIVEVDIVLQNEFKPFKRLVFQLAIMAKLLDRFQYSIVDIVPGPLKDLI